jgi:uncharacterized protein YcbK (DUF882 family)
MTDRWNNFTEDSLSCSCCGESNTSLEFTELMDVVQEMREELGFPFPVTSAYRCPVHPIEKKKESPGQHAIAAIDINVYDEKSFKLIKLAIEKGITGIGVNQKGPRNKRFIHLDMRENPTTWSY